MVPEEGRTNEVYSHYVEVCYDNSLKPLPITKIIPKGKGKSKRVGIDNYKLELPLDKSLIETTNKDKINVYYDSLFLRPYLGEMGKSINTLTLPDDTSIVFNYYTYQENDQVRKHLTVTKGGHVVVRLIDLYECKKRQGPHSERYLALEFTGLNNKKVGKLKIKPLNLPPNVDFIPAKTALNIENSTLASTISSTYKIFESKHLEFDYKGTDTMRLDYDFSIHGKMPFPLFILQNNNIPSELVFSELFFWSLKEDFIKNGKHVESNEKFRGAAVDYFMQLNERKQADICGGILHRLVGFCTYRPDFDFFNHKKSELTENCIRTFSGDCEDLALLISQLFSTIIAKDTVFEASYLQRVQSILSKYVCFVVESRVTCHSLDDNTQTVGEYTNRSSDRLSEKLKEGHGKDNTIKTSAHMNCILINIAWLCDSLATNLFEAKQDKLQIQEIVRRLKERVDSLALSLPKMMVLEGTGRYNYVNETEECFASKQKAKPKEQSFVMCFLKEKKFPCSNQPFLLNVLIGFTDYFIKQFSIPIFKIAFGYDISNSSPQSLLNDHVKPNQGRTKGFTYGVNFRDLCIGDRYIRFVPYPPLTNDQLLNSLYLAKPLNQSVDMNCFKLNHTNSIHFRKCSEFAELIISTMVLLLVSVNLLSITFI